MSNTTLQIRHSTIAGNTPPSLANGEIAINSRDGILYYSTPSGTVTAFNSSTGPAGLNKEIQFNDSGSLGGSEKLTFDKATGELVVNGTVRANIFSDDGVDLYDFSNRAFTAANAALTAANASSNVLMSVYETQGTGACTTFDIGFKPYTANSIFVAIDGVLQSDTMYSVNPAANTIIFDEAPGVSENVRIIGFKQVNPYILDDGSVQFIKLQSSVSGTINASFNQANAAFIRANNSLNCNVGGNVTANVTVTANLFASNVATGTYIQFGDGTKQYTANAGSGGGGADQTARDTANAAFARANTSEIVFVIDGGGSTISTGLRGSLEVPFNCNVVSWTILADQNGTIRMNVFNETYSTWGSTLPRTNEISFGVPISITSSASKNNYTLATQASIAASNLLSYNVQSVSTITRVTVCLKVIKT
jgi:hypothetical protein